VEQTAADHYERGLRLQAGDPDAAVSELKAAADLGYAPAYSRLANIFLRGWGVPEDHEAAVYWLDRVAAAGDLEARYNLGYQYYAGRGVAEDKAAAAEHWRVAGEGGFALAMSNLGSLYSSGEGVFQDAEQAVIWLRRAAEAGDAAGQMKLGVCYKAGLGVAQDYKEALRWLHAAAAQGETEALAYLGEFFVKGLGQPTDRVEGARWYYKAAQQGHAEARQQFDRLDRELRDAADADSAEGQRYLGLVFLEGIDMDPDAEVAVAWFMLAASKDDARANMSLAQCYAAGQGVEVDVEQAVEHCMRAARAGLPEALYEAGLLHTAAGGFDADTCAKAMQCFKAAAEGGHTIAQAHVDMENYYLRALKGNADSAGTLGSVFVDHPLIRRDYEQAVHWLEQALESAYNGELSLNTYELSLKLGRLYLHGGSTTTLLGSRQYTRNPEGAVRWLEGPARGGDTEARTQLARLYADRESGVYDLQNAIDWVNLACANGDESALPIVQAAYDQDEAAARSQRAREWDAQRAAERDSGVRNDDPFIPPVCGFCGGSGTELQTRGHYVNGHYWGDTYTTCLHCMGTGLLYH
jgi:uncharacterized protein